MTTGAAASKKKSDFSPVSFNIGSVSVLWVSGPVATIVYSSVFISFTVSRISSILGCSLICFVTRAENLSRSTASAPPAGTLVLSAQSITRLPILRISSFKSPQALSRPLPFKELEQTSSHKFSFVCAGEKTDGFIS